ncbi:hypothetical protein EVAR_17781_1 [Eumeta japonica]|uniref:Uncharacterized protein n=1 Tax=Eumeta variegata TaxID=151549 RepID=A0A4C1TTE9_EUMVA|nr:hypothetical protein EVAR_17781_1 [Eumeta japonica]
MGVGAKELLISRSYYPRYSGCVPPRTNGEERREEADARVPSIHRHRSKPPFATANTSTNKRTHYGIREQVLNLEGAPGQSRGPDCKRGRDRMAGRVARCGAVPMRQLF